MSTTVSGVPSGGEHGSPSEAGSVQVGRDIKGPVTITIVNGSFDRLADSVFDVSPLAEALDLAHFTGRNWLITQIDQAIATQDRGYIVVQAEAGVGKSSLAARLVWTRPCAYHFTRIEGARSPVQARRSIAAQLIGWWGLAAELCPGDMFPQGADRPDWLGKVLRMAAAKRDEQQPDVPLVIVVDGLDEADPPAPGQDTGVPLGLPRPEHLPKGVYIVATSRFGVPLSALRGRVAWHEILVDGPDNLADMRSYISDAARGPRAQEQLVDVLAENKVPTDLFVDALVQRCAGVWIYLRYVLDDIISRRRKPGDLDNLPDDVAAYYLEQIQDWQEGACDWAGVGQAVLATLAAIQRPVTRAELAELAGVNDREGLRPWLDNLLRPFLSVTRDTAQGRLYAIRHQSFRDLLEAPPHLDERDAGMREALHEALIASHVRITSGLVPAGSVGNRDWASAGPYCRTSLAWHAASAGVLDELITDPGFLLITDPSALLRQRPTVASPQALAGIAAYELAFRNWAQESSDDRRLWWLHVWAHKVRCHTLATAAAIGQDWSWRLHAAIWVGTSHRTLDGHTYGLIAVCVVPDATGRNLLAVAGDETVCLWDPTTGAPVGEPIACHHSVSALCAVPDGAGRTLLASAGPDQTVRLWDPATGAQVGEPLSGHTDSVFALCAVPDGAGRTLLASAGPDQTVRLWDPATGDLLSAFVTGHTWGVSQLCAVPDGAGRTLLASAGRDQTVRLWDPATGALVGTPPTSRDMVFALCSVRDGSGRALLVTGGRDTSVQLWDPATGDPIGEPFTGHTNSVQGLCAVLDGNGRTLLASVGDRTVRLWDVNAAAPTGEPHGHSDSVYAACAVTDRAGRTLLATASGDGTVRLWDPTMGCLVGEPLAGHTDAVSAVCEVPDGSGGTLLASGSRDGTVRLWDPATGNEVGEPLPASSGAVFALCAVPDGTGRTLLVSGGRDHAVRLWDPATGHLVAELATGHTWGVSAMCSVPDSSGRTLLATASDDKTVRLWDVATSRLVGMPLTGHARAVNAICAIRDDAGRTLLATASEGEVWLWDPSTGNRVCELLTGYSLAVRALCAVPDGTGRTLLASAISLAVCLWDPSSGDPVGELLIGHTDWVHALCAVPDSSGRTLLTSSGADHAVLLWTPTAADTRM
ncbi:hypothetical protein NRK68_28845 [Streptomyces yangpuensis]|uniref:WD40 repeat n=1 Tax=Streptomyces yangpuensis TaxID=1648182 RepID=A0ABY5Q4W0_9ACTN|nr:hypothetical protein [Streptomyces yangpuensis]UUY50888.1 hypothetical protein NRK68_28845 [Streptomyces yangpuensis]